MHISLLAQSPAFSVDTVLSPYIYVFVAAYLLSFVFTTFFALLLWAGAALAVYLASGLVVDLTGAQLYHSTQTSQLALSGFWSALGFANLPKCRPSPTQVPPRPAS